LYSVRYFLIYFDYVSDLLSCSFDLVIFLSFVLTVQGRGVPLRPPGMTKKDLKALRAIGEGPLWQACRHIYEESGLRGFWRGNGINILKVIPDEGLKYVAIE
jgi:hypothetical protein